MRDHSGALEHHDDIHGGGTCCQTRMSRRIESWTQSAELASLVHFSTSTGLLPRKSVSIGRQKRALHNVRPESNGTVSSGEAASRLVAEPGKSQASLARGKRHSSHLTRFCNIWTIFLYTLASAVWRLCLSFSFVKRRDAGSLMETQAIHIPSPSVFLRASPDPPSAPTAKPNAPKHARRQSSAEAKKKAPRKSGGAMNGSVDAGVVKPKQSKSRNGIY